RGLTWWEHPPRGREAPEAELPGCYAKVVTIVASPDGPWNSASLAPALSGGIRNGARLFRLNDPSAAAGYDDPGRGRRQAGLEYRDGRHRLPEHGPRHA